MMLTPKNRINRINNKKKKCVQAVSKHGTSFFKLPCCQFLLLTKHYFKHQCTTFQNIKQLHPSQLGISYGTINKVQVAFPCPQAACDKYIHEACISGIHLGIVHSIEVQDIKTVAKSLLASIPLTHQERNFWDADGTTVPLYISHLHLI
jgi:hypothetical protein